MPKQLNGLKGHTDSTVHSLGLCTVCMYLNLKLPSRHAMGSGTFLTIKWIYNFWQGLLQQVGHICTSKFIIFNWFAHSQFGY